MVDWQGLLKFSLQYSDGTKQSSFKQMKKQDKQWLQQAIKSYCNSQIQRITQILKQLNKPEDNNQQFRLNLLEQLQQLLDSLDRGSTLYKMGGHIVILKIIFFSKFDSNRVVALQIFSSINQNDAYVQTQSINSGALQMVQLIRKQTSLQIRQNMISSISAMIRGQNLQAKRIFIRLNGLGLLQDLLNQKHIQSKKLQNKILTLVRDLVYYDDRLHYTYNDLSSFSNTANIKLTEQQQQKKKGSLTFDKNKQIINNQLQQNKKYKGCIKQFLKQKDEINWFYQKWVKEQIQLQSQ